jgi:hypothetical protein
VETESKTVSMQLLNDKGESSETQNERLLATSE